METIEILLLIMAVVCGSLSLMLAIKSKEENGWPQTIHCALGSILLFIVCNSALIMGLILSISSKTS